MAISNKRRPLFRVSIPPWEFKPRVPQLEAVRLLGQIHREQVQPIDPPPVHG